MVISSILLLRNERCDRSVVELTIQYNIVFSYCTSVEQREGLFLSFYPHFGRFCWCRRKDNFLVVKIIWNSLVCDALYLGNISKAAQRIKPDDSRDENDGSLETKEELSPGSADKAELAKHAKKETADDVPLEVKQNLHKDTIEFLHNQSGKSAQGHGG